MVRWREFELQTRKRSEWVDVTSRVQEAVARSGIGEGFCLVYCPHTTAGVAVNEHADPAVAADIVGYLDRTVPREGSYRHAEGNSDAHVKAALVGTSQWLPVRGGRLALGTWQGVFFCEFDGPRTRRVLVGCLGASPLSGEG